MEQKEIPLIFSDKINEHKLCRPPKEAYLYFPKETEYIDIDEKNPKLSKRKIFEAKGDINFRNYQNNYTSSEINFLETFFIELEKYNKNSKNTYLDISELKISEILKFLQSTQFDNLKTIVLVKDHLAWRHTMFPIKITKNIEEILNSGFMYIHGRDSCFRPIVILNLQRYLQLKEQKYPMEDVIISIIYLCEYLLNYMLIPGQIETWDIIGDINNVKLFSIPKDLLNLLSILQKNYRARLNALYVLGMSTIMSYIWNLLKGLIDPVTHKKIKFFNNNSELLENINPEQLEEKYGGLCKNLENYHEINNFNKINLENIDSSKPEYNVDKFFPPTMPSEKCLKIENDKNQNLITEDKYRELFIENKLRVVSPYFNENLNQTTVKLLRCECIIILFIISCIRRC
jgi:hypothetical protein